MKRLHRFVVVKTHGIPERWFDDVRAAFANIDPVVDRVFVTLEETGSRYRVLRP